ncbi:MAG: methyltransferase domain-containing protein [Bacteroidota bacterium]
MGNYVHGYSVEEAHRLNDQAQATADFLHYDSIWPEGSHILEAGCGVGAQTRIIAAQNPSCRFTSIDISPDSVAQANATISSLGLENVTFQQADIFQLPFADNSFDHVFICFVLEHLGEPVKALKEVQRVLKLGGTVTVIEGDHGSTYFHPDSLDAQRAVQHQITLQQLGGGDANIGRRLYPLMASSGLEKVQISPRQIYVDDSKPALVEGFTLNTFTAMIEGIAEDAIEAGLTNRQDMEKGISDLARTAKGGGTFCYTFFKGKGLKP